MKQREKRLEKINRQEKEEKRKKTGQRENKELDGRFNPKVSVITLNVHGLSIPIKEAEIIRLDKNK